MLFYKGGGSGMFSFKKASMLKLINRKMQHVSRSGEKGGPSDESDGGK